MSCHRGEEEAAIPPQEEAIQCAAGCMATAWLLLKLPALVLHNAQWLVTQQCSSLAGALQGQWQLPDNQAEQGGGATEAPVQAKDVDVDSVIVDIDDVESFLQGDMSAENLMEAFKQQPGFGQPAASSYLTACESL
jgi:hypothetical protein